MKIATCTEVGGEEKAKKKPPWTYQVWATLSKKEEERLTDLSLEGDDLIMLAHPSPVLIFLFNNLSSRLCSKIASFSSKYLTFVHITFTGFTSFYNFLAYFGECT